MIYSKHPRVKSKTDNIIDVMFDDEWVEIRKSDEIFVLIDPSSGKRLDKPTIITMTFDEFSNDIDEENGFINDLANMYGISLIAHY